MNSQCRIQRCYQPTSDLIPSRTKSILVVDDDQAIREVIEIYLYTMGYHVASVSNGMEALTFLDKFTCDLVITDLQMPVMDGYELIRNLRSKSQRPVIVVLSAMRPTEGEQKEFLETACAILEKPFLLKELTSVVEDALRI